MSEVAATHAARNNASWCDAVCSAHGRSGELSASHWVSRARTPPYYPNLVTFERSSEPAMAAVRELERAQPSASWAVKDSFAVLPLDRFGFRLLFEAEWILRPTSRERPRARRSTTRWSRVQSKPDLAAWEAAWGQSRGAPRIFLPPLLRRPEIAILGARGGGGAIKAGVIANRTEHAVGLSNFFAIGEERVTALAECIAAATNAFPGLPLVGYESGRDLAESRALGFESLGPLRVWIWDAQFAPRAGVACAARGTVPQCDGVTR